MATDDGTTDAPGGRNLPTDHPGARLRRARIAAGRSQRDLAEVCGISRARLSRIEHGQELWDESLTLPLSVVLGISPRDFVAVTAPGRASRATALDRAIGARIRDIRLRHGLTQPQLADAIGVTYQQVHKYENGRNRISAGRILEIAAVLSVEPAELLAVRERPESVWSAADEQRVRELVEMFVSMPVQRQQTVLRIVRDLV